MDSVTRELICILINCDIAEMNKILNHFFLGYIILWPLFYNFILPIDGAGRIYMILSVLILLLNLLQERFRAVFRNPIVWIWFMWVVYSIINWISCGYPPPENLNPISFICIYLILPWLSMYVAIYESQVRPRLLLKNLHVLFFIYVLLGFLFQVKTGAVGERGGNILGNSLPLVSLCLVFISCLCYSYRLIKVPSFISAIILSMLCIFMVATRKAFAGELIILFAFFYGNIKKINVQSVLGLLCLGLVLYFTVPYLLENSILGERFMNISDDAEAYNTTNSKFLSLLGDRAYFYITGWELFKEFPVCGIGINNYMNVTDYPMPIHSEYIVQLAENGLIGCFLFVLFIVALFKTVLSVNVHKSRWIFLGWVFSILFISFTAWIYDCSQYFIIFGVIVGMINNRNNLNCLL